MINIGISRKIYQLMSSASGSLSLVIFEIYNILFYMRNQQNTCLELKLSPGDSALHRLDSLHIIIQGYYIKTNKLLLKQQKLVKTFWMIDPQGKYLPDSQVLSGFSTHPYCDLR